VSRAHDPFAPEAPSTPPAAPELPTPSRPLLVGAKPAAAILGRRGEIRAVRLGGRVLFAHAELERVARGEGGAS
jgi:hypothetical protein